MGDLAETLTLIVPPGRDATERPLSHWIEQRLLPLRGLPESQQHDEIVRIWQETSVRTRFVAMKLITGAMRVGVSKKLVTRAIADQFDLAPDVVSHRLMGDWSPTSDFFSRLIDADVNDAMISQPYPFCLAHPIDIDQGPEKLGAAGTYIAEWKWDGIRGQVIRRQQQTFIWVARRRADGKPVARDRIGVTEVARRHGAGRRDTGIP